MKNSSVRRPDIGNTSAEGINNADMSIGDIMRAAKKNLILTRVLYALLLLIILALFIYAIVTGFAADCLDKFFSLMD
ncbi:MAG: hypothetical protein MJ108_00310 [Saccharofermentans sp.]|nr:hypothetical protein [Saccharofermentans sp.]